MRVPDGDWHEITAALGVNEHSDSDLFARLEPAKLDTADGATHSVHCNGQALNVDVGECDLRTSLAILRGQIFICLVELIHVSPGGLAVEHGRLD